MAVTRIKRQKQYHPSLPSFSAWGTTAKLGLWNFSS